MGVLAIAVAACGGTVATGGDAGKDAGADAALGDASLRVPKNHRPADVTCPSGRGTEDGQFGDSGVLGSCSRDSDCTQGTNGRCLPNIGGAFILSCSYDTCASDVDCPGTVCVCRSSTTDVAPNVCGSSKSNCRIDSDCGPNGFCSPTESADVFCFSTDLVYACHTAQDECVDDSDCPASDPSCNYDPSVSHWKCGSLCSPPPP